MTDDGHKVLTGYVLDETVTLTLAELSGVCRVREEQIIELVAEGVIEPEYHQRNWAFPSTQLRRVGKAVRLQRDLEVNAAGVALILDLLEEIEELRARLG